VIQLAPMKKSEPHPSPPGPAHQPVEIPWAPAWSFRVRDPSRIKRWLADTLAPGPPTWADSPAHRFKDQYLDTADLKFLRAGYALRARRASTGTEVTLEPAPGACVPAHRMVLPRAIVDLGMALGASDGPISERLRLLCQPEELHVVAEVRGRRQAMIGRLEPSPSGDAARSPDGEGSEPSAGSSTAAEALLVLNALLLTDSLGRTHRGCCLEVAARPGDEGTFRPVVDRMQRECELEGAPPSALAWALEAAGIRVDRTMGFGEASVDPTRAVGEVLDAILRRQHASFLWHEPGTRLGDDPEHLHDMRVACRRMRAALKLFGEALPPGEADDLRNQLGAIGRRLGAVRDLDVFMEQLRELGESLLCVGPGACDPLLLHLSRRRERARRAMLKMLDSPSFAATRQALARRLDAGPQPGLPGSQASILRVGPDLVRRCRRRVRRLASRLEPGSPAPAYHELRIRGKRLRYALEFLEGVYGPPARNLVGPLVEIQDLLGLQQDAQVSIAALREIAARDRSGFSRETWVAIGELAQAYHARARGCREGVPRVLRRLRGGDWRALRRTMDGLAHTEAAGGSDPR
jgi:triphosphatase